ncbi:MAG: hypothetical protein FWB74_02920 [Defluviitaleaceae bacterium]|nr:hypothetical protein [Defluviitaleaceae bacterium]
MKTLPPRKPIQEIFALIHQEFWQLPNYKILSAAFEADVLKEPEKSAPLHRKIGKLFSSSNLSKAFNMIAIEYGDGSCLPQSTEKEISWSMLAATEGNSGAFVSLAYFALEKNKDLAVQLLMQAIEIDDNETARRYLQNEGFDA